MLWNFVSSQPLTTERFRAVETADGRKGYVSIRHVNGRPQPYGGICDVPDNECYADGTPVTPRCLDHYPTFG